MTSHDIRPPTRPATRTRYTTPDPFMAVSFERQWDGPYNVPNTTPSVCVDDGSVGVDVGG